MVLLILHCAEAGAWLWKQPSRMRVISLGILCTVRLFSCKGQIPLYHFITEPRSRANIRLAEKSVTHCSKGRKTRNILACRLLWHFLCICLFYHRVQISIQIRGTVHPVHLGCVIQTPPVLRSHLTCAPLHGYRATGVNAIKDTPKMALTAQVS